MDIVATVIYTEDKHLFQPQKPYYKRLSSIKLFHDFEFYRAELHLMS